MIELNKKCGHSFRFMQLLVYPLVIWFQSEEIYLFSLFHFVLVSILCEQRFEPYFSHRAFKDKKEAFQGNSEDRSRAK